MDIVEDAPHNEPLAPHIATATERNIIPASDTERLIELQLRIINAPGDRTASEGLDLLCAQLQKRRYTYQAIANVLDVSRQMVQQRASRVPEDALAGIQTEAARKVPKPEKTKAERQWLSEDELARLVDLRPLAQLRRGSTPKDSPVARAADDFSLILLEARERGVTESTMAQQLDMTPAAIRFRLQRITGDLPPSMRPKSEQDKVVRDPFDGLEDELGELRDLLREAEIQVGRGPNHADRLTASRRFDEMLTRLVTSHQVPLGALAAQLGRSRSSLAMRLTSHVGGDAASKILDSDSQQAYDLDRATDDLPDLDIDGAIRPDPAYVWRHGGRSGEPNAPTRLRRSLPAPDRTRDQQTHTDADSGGHRRNDPAAPARRHHHRPELGSEHRHPRARHRPPRPSRPEPRDRATSRAGQAPRGMETSLGDLDAHHGQPRPSSPNPITRCRDQPHAAMQGTTTSPDHWPTLDTKRLTLMRVRSRRAIGYVTVQEFEATAHTPKLRVESTGMIDEP
ncbi:hypothetical protein AB0A63_00270 [Lentzea sp. NPDC042327]|uniref:hypothetical protein n=1 Tax=Lentzea sp. NPDC042327 TaxID=3154801 RepID=UPI0033F5F855